jgi:hypothetical protein
VGRLAEKKQDVLSRLSPSYVLAVFLPLLQT